MELFKPLNLKVSFSVCFSPNGQLLAVAGKKVHVWDLADRTCVEVEKGFSDPTDVTFSPDSSRVSVKNTSGRIAINDAKSGDLIVKFEDSEATEGSDCVFSPCGEFIVDGSWDGEFKARKSATGNVVFEHEFPNEMITHVQDFKKGTKILTQHQPKWDDEKQRSDLPYFLEWSWPLAQSKARQIPLLHAVHSGFALNENGSLLAVIDRSFPKADLILYSFPEMKCVSKRTILFKGDGMAWSADGSMLAVVEHDGLNVYDRALTKALLRVPVKYGASVDFSPNGRLIALGDWSKGCVVESPMK